MLLSPVIRPEKKVAVLDAIFSGKIEELTRQFYKLLSQKRREKFLEGIARQFVAKYKKHHNIHVIEIRTVCSAERNTQGEDHQYYRDTGPKGPLN